MEVSNLEVIMGHIIHSVSIYICSTWKSGQKGPVMMEESKVSNMVGLQLVVLSKTRPTNLKQDLAIHLKIKQDWLRRKLDEECDLNHIVA